MFYNDEIRKVFSEVSEVAGYLWEKGWAERNGGNISYNITGVVDDGISGLSALGEECPLPEAVPELSGEYFLVTGTGCRMRKVSSDLMNNAAIIRIMPGGGSYEIIAEKYVKPTSELPSHLLIHAYLKRVGRKEKAVIHTHPTELVAMTHNDTFLQKDVLSKLLWSMIPETRAFCPKGVGVVRYELPGSLDLAHRTIDQLAEYDAVLWEKHGALAIGENLTEAFDFIDTLSKSAQIYVSARSMGYVPAGLSERQMAELKEVFNL